MILLFSYIQTWFIQGLLHPVLTPSHIVLLVSLGLIIGQQGIKLAYIASIIVSIALGMFLKDRLDINVNIELILLVLALIVSLLTVLKLRLPRLFILFFIISSSLIIAYDSDPIVIPGAGTNSINNWLLGALMGILATVEIVSLIATFLRRFWDGVILRVIGSWIATSAIFILALSLTTLTKGLG